MPLVPTQAWILTAVGKDRPGIVAGVTKLLFEMGCNLEDSAMTRLSGEFAMMLVFVAPTRVSVERLERACAALGRRLKLAVHLKLLPAAERRPSLNRRPYLISVYGADRPGIVYHISKLLADHRVNITDVSTHRAAGGGGRRATPLYLMLLEVELPGGLSADRLDGHLRQLTRRLKVEVSLRSAETNIL